MNKSQAPVSVARYRQTPNDLSR